MLDERKTGRLAANIGFEKVHSAFSSDFCCHTTSASCVAVDKCHLGPLGDEAAHCGFPDTGRPTGHGSNHSIELSHWRFLFCWAPRAYELKVARYKTKLIRPAEGPLGSLWR